MTQTPYSGRTKLSVQIRYVDGGYSEDEVDSTILSRYGELVRQGYREKGLIHALWTDDFGAPPLVFQIVGVDENGRAVNITIPYKSN